MNFTASLAPGSLTEVAVTTRPSFEPAEALDVTLTFAVSRWLAPGASDGVRYVPATTAAVTSVVPTRYFTV